MHLVTLAAVTTTSQPAVAGRTEQQEQQHGQRPCRHGPSIYQPTSGVVSSDRLRRKWVNVNEWWPVKEGACFAIHGNTIRITLPICAGDARMQFGWGRVIQLTWPTRLCRQGTIRACVPVAVASNSIYSGITISTVKKAARRHRARRAKVRAAAGRPADQGRIGGAWKGQARRAAWEEGREGSSLCRRANKRGERALQEEAAGRPPGPRPPRSACMVPHAVMHAPNAGPAGRMGNSTSSRPQGRETMLVRGVRPSRIRPRHFSWCPSPNRARGFYFSCHWHCHQEAQHHRPGAGTGSQERKGEAILNCMQWISLVGWYGGD